MTTTERNHIMISTSTNYRHFHVFAAQDWGGSQQRVVGWDDQLYIEQAHQFVDDVIFADTRHPEGKSAFGYHYHELASDNVAPGWEAIWIIGCETPCLFDTIPSELGEPYWTAATVDREGKPLPGYCGYSQESP